MRRLPDSSNPDCQSHAKIARIGLRKLPNLIVATVVLTATLRADDQKESYSASKTVIVTDRAAPIMASENTLTTVPAGTVLLYTKENGDWLLVPRFGGWLKRENSVPIERSEEHFSRVIKMQPSAAAYQHRGAARLATGSFQGAIDDFTKRCASTVRPLRPLSIGGSPGLAWGITPGRGKI